MTFVLATKDEVNRHRAHLDPHPTRAAFKHRSPPTQLPTHLLTFHSPTTHARPASSLLDNDFCSCARPGCRAGARADSLFWASKRVRRFYLFDFPSHRFARPHP